MVKFCWHCGMSRPFAFTHIDCSPRGHMFKWHLWSVVTLLLVPTGSTHVEAMQSHTASLEEIQQALRARDLALPSCKYTFDVDLLQCESGRWGVLGHWRADWWISGSNEAIRHEKSWRQATGLTLESRKHAAWDGVR